MAVTQTKLELIDTALERKRALARERRRRHRALCKERLKVFRMALSPFDMADLLHRHGVIDDPDAVTFEELQAQLKAWLTVLGQYT
jgi:hypothetical protein